MSESKPKPKRDLDERTKIDLPPEEALRGLLKVDPEAKAEMSDDELRRLMERVIADEPVEGDQGPTK